MSYFLFLGPVRLNMYVLHGGYASACKKAQRKAGKMHVCIRLSIRFINERISGRGSCREQLKNREGEMGKGEERE